jgi:Putative esterase
MPTTTRTAIPPAALLALLLATTAPAPARACAEARPVAVARSATGATAASGARTGPTAPPPSATAFHISFPATAHSGPVTGRIYVMISRTDQREPRFQVGRTGVPFFGRDVLALQPRRPATIDGSDLGFPVDSLAGLPAGDYYVQAFVNVYSRFPRADGHVVWMHDDQWEGQQWRVSPGNLYSDVEHVHLDPHQGYDIALEASHVIPPVQVPSDTKWVKRFRFQSPMLSKFWGRPIYLGATVLLPRGYDADTTHYPVLYHQGHFSLAPPLGFRQDAADSLYRAWTSDAFPRVLVVTFQHPTPYFDDSYAVNSVNVGPYGDAIMQELIPEIEKRFRAIPAPWARWLDGGSTGGWESLALMVFHPEDFAATWSYCPDPVTFTNVEGYDVYSDDNAYSRTRGWVTVPIPNSRETDGAIRTTSRQRNYFELVSGTHGRSGEQQDVWEAVFGPLGDDGYFEPVFDKRTGAMDHTVAQYWKDHYDILEYLKRNWPTLGPKLAGKLHIYVGTMDTYYLDVAVRQLQAWLKTTTNPHYEGAFEYGLFKPHCYTGDVSTTQRLVEMATFAQAHQPAGASRAWWQRR